MFGYRHDEVLASLVTPPPQLASGCKSAEQWASPSSQNTKVIVALIPAGLLIKLLAYSLGTRDWHMATAHQPPSPHPALSPPL